MTENENDRLTRALLAAARAVIHELEDGATALPLRTGHVEATETAGGSPERILYDPLVDEPSIQPKPAGSREEQGWCSLTFLGAIARTNAERRRGANTHEVGVFARKAGYPDGRAVNGWNTSKDGTRQGSVENVDGLRILNKVGLQYLEELQDRLNVDIVGDLPTAADIEALLVTSPGTAQPERSDLTEAGVTEDHGQQ